MGERDADLRARAEAVLSGTPVYAVEDNDPSDWTCAFDTLVGPGDFRCRLGEPEDREWFRDAKGAVDRLNEQHALLRELTEENARLRAGLTEACDIAGQAVDALMTRTDSRDGLALLAVDRGRVEELRGVAGGGKT